MGVYIKGMEMPKSCAGCPTCREGTTLDGDYWLMCGYNGKPLESEIGAWKPDWCPLVPVPPHGRLGDLDALKDAVCANCYADEIPTECDAPCMDVKIIMEAPTIIPAEEGET